MFRLPRMVGILVLVACAGCSLATADTGASLSPVASREAFTSDRPIDLVLRGGVEVTRRRARPPATTGTTRTPASQAVCPDSPEAAPSPGAARANEELMANTTFQRAMTDVLRLEIAVEFCELRPDTLTLDLGEGAFSSASTEYNLSRLHAAYRTLTEYRRESTLELRYQDRPVGWFTVDGLTWTERPTPPPAPPEAAELAEADEARDEGPRSGLHFHAGLGAGSFDRQCAGCDQIDSELGFSGFLSLGGLVDPKTVLGVEGTGWTKEESDFRTEVYSVMAQVTRYAGATSDLFLRAGVGLVGYRNDADLTALAPGFSGRLGYEIGNGKVHAVPYVGYIRTFDGADLKRDGEEVGFNFVISQLQFGLSISVY